MESHRLRAGGEAEVSTHPAVTHVLFSTDVFPDVKPLRGAVWRVGQQQPFPSRHSLEVQGLIFRQGLVPSCPALQGLCCVSAFLSPLQVYKWLCLWEVWGDAAQPVRSRFYLLAEVGSHLPVTALRVMVRNWNRCFILVKPVSLWNVYPLYICRHFSQIVLLYT